MRAFAARVMAGFRPVRDHRRLDTRRRALPPCYGPPQCRAPALLFVECYIAEVPALSPSKCSRRNIPYLRPCAACTTLSAALRGACSALQLCTYLGAGCNTLVYATSTNTRRPMSAVSTFIPAVVDIRYNYTKS